MSFDVSRSVVKTCTFYRIPTLNGKNDITKALLCVCLSVTRLCLMKNDSQTVENFKNDECMLRIKLRLSDCWYGYKYDGR